MDNAQEFYVYNPVKPNKELGRRTGKPLSKKRNIHNGANNFDDYLTDSEDEASINVTKNLQSSDVEGPDSSQKLKDVLSSGKAGATKAKDLSFRKDAAAKSIQQLPPENFDSVRIVNPLILGSRFGRRTGKDVLSGKALAGGLEDFSAFLSDNTDISMSMQATPSPCAPSQPLPSTSAKKNSSITSAKKYRDRTPILLNTDFDRPQQEIPSFHAVSSEQQCSQQVHEPSCEEQGTTLLHVTGCIISAVDFEHPALAFQDTSSNEAGNKKLQHINKENQNSIDNLNTSKVKNSYDSSEKANVGETLTKATPAGSKKDNFNTSKVKNVCHDKEKACMGESLSKATPAQSEKENINTSEVKNIRHDKEKACLEESMSKTTQTRPKKGKLDTSEVKNVCPNNEKVCMGESVSETTQAVPETENLNTSEVKRSRNVDEKARMSKSMSKSTHAGPEKKNVNTSKVESNRNDDEQTRLGLSLFKSTQAAPEKPNLTSELEKEVVALDKTEKLQTTCGNSENNNLGKKDKAKLGQDSSAEESTNSVSDLHRVVPGQLSQTAAQQVQCLDSSKGNKTRSGQSLPTQSTDAQVQEKSGAPAKPESVTASQAVSSKQKSSITITNVHIPSISDGDTQSQSENSLQTTDFTGLQGASKHMTKSLSNLNFGGDVTGSVSRSEQAAGGQFFGIKKRLSFTHALKEVEEPSVKYKRKVDIIRLAQALPREKKSIGSFLGHHDKDNSDHLSPVAADTGTFVTLAAGRISQLTSDAELLKALNTSTDSPDDFCIVEEDNIVFDSSEVAKKQKNIQKSDKKQPKHTKNGNSSSAKQVLVDEEQLQTRCTDIQKDDKVPQLRPDSLREESQITDSGKKRKNRKSSRVILDLLDTSLEARTFISLTQKVTDATANRRKKVKGDNSIKKRKVKHSMKDEASPPKQIRADEEQYTDTDVNEKDLNCEVFNNTKLLKLHLTKKDTTKPSVKNRSVDKQVKQIKENNNVSNTNEKQNYSQEADNRKKTKVRKKLRVSEKLQDVENSQLSPPENKMIADLSTKQNNSLKIGQAGGRMVQSKSGKSDKQNKAECLSKELKQLEDRKLPKLKSRQRSRSIVPVGEGGSDNSSSNLLQQESVTLQNPATDTATENSSPVQGNSQKRRTRTRQASKLVQHSVVRRAGQHLSDTLSGQSSFVTQSSEHPPVTQSRQQPSVTQSEQNLSITQPPHETSVTQSEKKLSDKQLEQCRQPAKGSNKTTAGKISKQKLKCGKRNKAGRGRRNQTSGRKTRATSILEKRKLTRLASNFNVNTIYESIAEEGSNISDINFNNTAHSIEEVSVSKYNSGVGKNLLADVSRKSAEKVKNVNKSSLEKTYTGNFINGQETSCNQGCDVNQTGYASEQNSAGGTSVDVSVPMELLETKKRRASRKSASGKVRRAVKSPPRNKSVHSESVLEDCSPPKLQLMSSLPKVTPRSGISFRRSRGQSSYHLDIGSCSPASVPRVPITGEECFTPRLKEQKTPSIASCLKTAGSSIKPRKKGRRVRISSIIDQRMCSPVDTDVSDAPSLATSSLLSVNSSPVHYGETTTNNIDSASRRTSVILPDLSYKIIRPESSQVQGLRRSTRTRVMRLNSHKGEEIIYRRDSSGFGLVVDSIQPSVGEAKVKALEERRRKKLKQRKLKAMNVPAKPPKRLSTHWKVDDVITSSNEVPVINPETNEPVLLELIARGDSATWYGPELDPITGTEPVALCLHLKQQMFTTGEMNMRALAEKPCEYTEHTLILYVICGKVLLRINSVSTIVDTGDSFFIPRGIVEKVFLHKQEVDKTRLDRTPGHFRRSPVE